ncbi:hypothetical protein ASE05_15900 [Mesorhizobium sp. Root172]|nr:hypothetical protein ASE05_15900 [Mesorhizobium sp. Root172]
MGYTVEMMRDGKAIRHAEVQASSDAEAAKTFGPVKDGLGREPMSGEWIRVTQAGVRTSWFKSG